MSALCTGQGSRLDRWAGSAARLHLDLHPLAAHQVHARTPLPPTAPVTPEDGGSGHREGRQQHAHLAGLGGGSALPLALLAQQAGATTADARPIDHAQATISFSATLVREERLAGRTAQGAIRLEGKGLPGEAAAFPGLSLRCRSYP